MIHCFPPSASADCNSSYARTEEQTRATADKLYELADYALRVSVDEALRNQEQTQDEEIEPEPDIDLQFG